MKTASRSALALILLANIGLGFGFLEIGEPIGLLAILALTILWLFGLYRKRRWAANEGLFFSYLLILLEAYLRVSVFWLLLSSFSALAAWDLCHFNARFADFEPSAMTATIQKKHFARLLFILALSLVLVLLALNLQFQLAFGWALLLGLLLLLGLNQILALIRRQSE